MKRTTAKTKTTKRRRPSPASLQQLNEAAYDLRERIDTRNTDTRLALAEELTKIKKELGDHIDGTGAALQRIENRMNERERLNALQTLPQVCTKPTPQYHCAKCHCGMECYGPEPKHYRCPECRGTFYP